MVRLALALLFAVAPPGESGERAEPEAAEPAPATIPSWRELPPLPPAPPLHPTRVKVPATGAGLITIGSVLVGTGAALAFTSVGMLLADDPDLGDPGLGFLAIPQISTGAALLTLGLVVRKQYRAKAISKVPDQPPTGGGMLLGGIGLMLGATMHGGFAIADVTSIVCSSTCRPDSSILGPFYLGTSVAAFGTGVALVAFGAKRRKSYVNWARYQPIFRVGGDQAVLGVSGRF